MGTSKHVIILLTLVLGGLLAAGQDKPVASGSSFQREMSNTRFASCIVRITVDPAIMPASLENIGSLLQSSGVAVKAGREVLSLKETEAFKLPFFKVEWLSASSAPTSLEAIYGRDYTQQMMGLSRGQKRDGAQETRPEEAPPRDGASGPRRPDRPDKDRMDEGRAGPSGAAAPPQEQPAERLPGESDVAYRTRIAQFRAQQEALRAQQSLQEATKSRGMGGAAGGMMGGYGGMGMGGMGGMSPMPGGMMGGYGSAAGMGGYGMGGMGMGGMGGRGFYGASGAIPHDARAEQSATVRLLVDLPDTVPPRADEFLREIVKNLQDTLTQAYESYATEIESALALAKAQHKIVASEPDGMAGDVARVRQQLETFIDATALGPQMPLEAAVEVLRRSVEPPLNIVVLWNDLRDNVTTPHIGITGMSRVKLRTVLDLLVKSLPARGVNLTWRIQDDTVVIGTAATLGRAPETGGLPRVETDAVNLAGQRSELVRRVQALELDLAGIDARREAIGVQILDIRKRVEERLLQDPAIQELEKLTQMYTRATTTPEGRLVSPNTPEAQQNLIRTRIELANRREELSRQAGGGQLEEFNKELSRMTIDKAEKEAQLQIVKRQFDAVQQQLVQALTFDPEAARLRLAQEALDITGRRVVELQTRLANLQPPTVTVIGAN